MFWQEYTPWINDYTSFINKGALERIFHPLQSTDEPIHRSINNIVSFIRFQNIISSKDYDIEHAFKKSKDIVRNYPRNGLDSYRLTREHIRIIDIQSERLFEKYKEERIIFAPKFNGCGILSNCEGDLTYNSTLVEIKAGERNILPSDIKQLLVYCSLDKLSSNIIGINEIEIFNPRQGILWRTSVNDLLVSISCLPPEDFFHQMGNYLFNASDEIIL